MAATSRCRSWSAARCSEVTLFGASMTSWPDGRRHPPCSGRRRLRLSCRCARRDRLVGERRAAGLLHDQLIVRSQLAEDIKLIFEPVTLNGCGTDLAGLRLAALVLLNHVVRLAAHGPNHVDGRASDGFNESVF